MSVTGGYATSGLIVHYSTPSRDEISYCGQYLATVWTLAPRLLAEADICETCAQGRVHHELKRDPE